MNQQPKDKALELQLLTTQLPEFQFSFGDATTHFLKYLVSQPNTETYLSKQEQYKIFSTKVYMHACYTKGEKRLRGLRLPNDLYLKAIDEHLVNGKEPFLILPFLLQNKGQCKDVPPNTSRHMMYLLYNRMTHELERIDIKKYHIRVFKIKLAYKTIGTKLLQRLQNVDDRLTFLSEHDVTPMVLRKLGTSASKYAFPIYMISYLQERFAHPEETSKLIQKRVDKLSRKTLLENWQAYVEFRLKKNLVACPEGKIPNMESKRCLIKSKKNIYKYSVDRPEKECPPQRTYDVLQDKCVRPEKIVNIDIALDKVMQVKVKRDAKVTHLGQSHTVLPSVMYVLSHHENAVLVLPKEGVAKDDISFRWTWNKEDQKFELFIPVGFWDSWTSAMLSPARFLIILMSLTSNEGGRHANVLIYDKTNNEMERFDGLGPDTAPAYGLEEGDKLIRGMFEERMGSAVPAGFKYFIPLDYCPRKVPVFQSKELDQIYFDDLRGNCAVWRLWYIDTRLSNPHLNRKEVVKYAMKKLETYGDFPRFIKSYQAFIAKQIDPKKQRKPKTGSQPTSNAQ